ncbi:mevalonate kinase [Methanolobus zinderi]|jgi:mevalonate kinase|uniref:Mevalonate kinase n=1 Tax=Methanolobus zinderi TaxID=536044 RepID=A0A7D5I831_9EURY|nr:mevalonate kinase [Methanolobus zinderi]KXS40464.1 MAG: mevalonate kinase [Methanolobus sp. T82-4]QLC49522.1 mevalonate kinase [Methanolobus zinderi]
MITCSAPGKVYLFGEHAVVYGQSAICCAIDLRTRVQAEEHDSIVIESVLGTTGLDQEVHPYVSRVIEKMKAFGNIRGVRIHIDSELPVGSGLGSSAAVTVASIQALNQLYSCGLQLEEVASMGHIIEREVQGNASPTDTYVSTMGGVVMIPERRRLNGLECSIIVGNTGKFSSTRELVANVAKLRQEFPDIIDPILNNIGRMSHLAEEHVNRYDYETMGKLMNVNQGLLDAIGVGGAELSELVYAARDAGAISAKITGAGGGGCMVALASKQDAGKIASAIRNKGAEAILTSNTQEGVRLEP